MAQVIRQEMFAAVTKGDVEAARRIAESHPNILNEPIIQMTWLHLAADEDFVPMVRLLVEECGIGVNTPRSPDEPDGPLTNAARSGCLNVARWLLDHGADVNAGNGARPTPLMSAAGNGHLEMAKLLVARGACINESWGKATALSIAIDYGHPDLADYLRSQGAVEPPPRKKGSGSPSTPVEEILDYVGSTVGPVGLPALTEIVPILPLDIHVVSPDDDGNLKMLITTGMSEERMNVPIGSETYAFAEVSITLHRRWPLSKEDMKDPNNYWPVEWLRIVAYYPHREGVWVGPEHIISNGDPPEPFAPNTLQSCILILNHGSLEPLSLRDGRIINFYQMIPLYREERDLQMTKGTRHLIRLFDNHGITPVVDPARPNVALLPGA
jgi:hypothetical protein